MFPRIWKRGVVKLIKKEEDKPPEEIKSYRPVTLLPVIGKLVERVVAGWSMKDVEEKISETVWVQKRSGMHLISSRGVFRK